MSDNFIFLKQEFPDLYGIATKAELSVYTDSNNTLNKSRIFAEYIVDYISNSKKINIINIPLIDKIKNLKDGTIISENVSGVMHELRIKGNNSVHKGLDSLDDAKNSLKSIFALGIWFFKSYAKDKTITLPATYILPPEKEKEPENNKNISETINSDWNNNFVKNHRFLSDINNKIIKGQNFFILYGRESYINDNFLYGSKLKLHSVSDSIVEYLKDRSLDIIITITDKAKKINLLKGKELFESLTKQNSISKDDLAGKSRNSDNIKTGQTYTQENLSSDAEIINYFEKIAIAMDKCNKFKIGIIVDDFITLINGFEGRQLNEQLIDKSLNVWKNKNQYSFFIVRGTEIGMLKSHGFSLEAKEIHPALTEIIFPNIFEISNTIVGISMKKKIMLNAPKQIAAKYIEESPKPNLNSIIIKFSNELNEKTEESKDESVLKFYNPPIKLKDVILDKEIKENIKKIYNNFLEKNGKKGIIFCGEPGTGKTMIAEALANESECYFKKTSMSDFKAGFVGQSGLKTRDIFNELIQNKPAILYIDEVDRVFPNRTGNANSGDSFTADIVNEFLANIEGIKDTNEIFVISSTNNIQLIDDAILSRFEVINIGLPNNNSVDELVKKYLGEKHLCESSKMYGLSGRDIKNIGADIKDLNKNIDFAIKNVIEKYVHTSLKRIGANLELPYKFSFDKIYGYKEVKEKIKRALKKDFYSFLFYGKSGTGKSQLTKAIASELNYYYIQLQTKSLLDGSISFKNVYNACKLLTNISGIVINLDEIDSAFTSSQAIRGILLQDIDDILKENNKKIILTSTTNFINSIDDAIKRRYKLKEEIQGMDSEGVVEYLLKEYPKFAKNQKIVNDLINKSFSQIEEYINDILLNED